MSLLVFWKKQTNKQKLFMLKYPLKFSPACEKSLVVNISDTKMIFDVSDF